MIVANVMWMELRTVSLNLNHWYNVNAKQILVEKIVILALLVLLTFQIVSLSQIVANVMWMELRTVSLNLNHWYNVNAKQILMEKSVILALLELLTFQIVSLSKVHKQSYFLGKLCSSGV